MSEIILGIRNKQFFWQKSKQLLCYGTKFNCLFFYHRTSKFLKMKCNPTNKKILASQLLTYKSDITIFKYKTMTCLQFFFFRCYVPRIQRGSGQVRTRVCRLRLSVHITTRPNEPKAFLHHLVRLMLQKLRPRHTTVSW